MKLWISLLALLLTGCAANNHVCPEPVVSSVEKTDTILFFPQSKKQRIEHLEKENHLLRVEIDHLKIEVERLEKLSELQEEIITAKKSLEAVKTEIGE